MLDRTSVSKEWKSRRGDEAFGDLHALGAKTRHDKQISKSIVVASRGLEAIATPNTDHQGLEIVGKQGVPYAPTHWSFGQLSGLAGAPASYLSKLPAELAADCINVGLKVLREVADVGLLLQKNGGPGILAAATGPNYGRIHNADIVDAVIDRFGNGLKGTWTVPGDKSKPKLFCSDRDLFMFMADETNRVTIPNRRDGRAGSMSRGFYIKNSEVGSTTLTLAMFLFDHLCENRTVFGVEEHVEINIRHTASAPTRFIEQVMPLLKQMSETSAGPLEAQLKAAQERKVDNLDAFLATRKFTKTEISGARSSFLTEEGRPLDTETTAPSLWDVNTALTAYAKRIPYQDERVNLERRAGKVLELARI